MLREEGTFEFSLSFLIIDHDSQEGIIQQRSVYVAKRSWRGHETQFFIPFGLYSERSNKTNYTSLRSSATYNNANLIRIVSSTCVE